MRDLYLVLKKSIIFSGLEAEDFQRLDPLFQRWPLHTGDILATAGHQAQFFFLLEQGCLLCAMDEGKSVVLDAPGDLIAMEMLSRKGVYTATLTALEDGGVWVVSRDAFLSFIQEDTEAAAAVMEGWQVFLDEKAPFARNIADIDIPVMF